MTSMDSWFNSNSNLDQQTSYLIELILSEDGDNIDTLIEMCKSDMVSSYQAAELLKLLPQLGYDDYELEEVLVTVRNFRTESNQN